MGIEPGIDPNHIDQVPVDGFNNLHFLIEFLQAGSKK